MELPSMTKASRWKHAQVHQHKPIVHKGVLLGFGHMKTKPNKPKHSKIKQETRWRSKRELRTQALRFGILIWNLIWFGIFTPARALPSSTEVLTIAWDYRLTITEKNDLTVLYISLTMAVHLRDQECKKLIKDIRESGKDLFILHRRYYQ